MRQFLFPFALAAVASCAGAAHAQTNLHSWVSSNATSSACTRSAPCGSFALAHDATFAGGVISILDPASTMSAINITKALTVRAVGVDGGPDTFPGGTFVTVAAGPDDVVTLEGLHWVGAGIVFNSGKHLHVVNCTIAENHTAGGAGIKFQPIGASKLSITDSVITNNGSGTGGGIVIKPASGGTAQVNLKRVTVNGNAFGIAADGTGSSGGINMTIADSMVGGNGNDGIIGVTPGGGAPIGVYVKNTQAVNNSIGIRSIGPNVTVRVDGSSVIGNGTGLSFSGGGALLTAGNNMVRANGSDGAFSGSVGLQ